MVRNPPPWSFSFSFYWKSYSLSAVVNTSAKSHHWNHTCTYCSFCYPSNYQWIFNVPLPPVLSTCPLHTNSGCGKERWILIGPWWPAMASTCSELPWDLLASCRRTLGSARHWYAITWPDKLGTDPMGYGGYKWTNGRRRGTREESRK